MLDRATRLAAALNGCQSARNRDLGSAYKKNPPCRRWNRVVQVASRRDPRATRSALTSDGAARAGGACLLTWATRGVGSGAGGLAGCLELISRPVVKRLSAGPAKNATSPAALTAPGSTPPRRSQQRRQAWPSTRST
jgi:hypothetical protein